MAIEYHSIFSPENLFISSSTEFSNACILSTDSGFRVIGTSTSEVDTIEIIWSTKDIINHGYCRYDEQTDLSGVVIEFEIETLENVIPYAHIENPQYLKIEETSGNIYKVPLSSLGQREMFSFNTTINDETVIDIENRWVQSGDTLTIYYIDNEGDRKYLSKDIDYTMDYTNGILTLVEDTVPNEAKIYVKGYKYSETKYRLDFNKLTDINGNRIFLNSVYRFSIPVSVDNSILAGDTFVFEIKNLNVSRGQLWQKPAQIKQHGFLLNDKYEYTKHLNPKALIYNIKKLGYAEKVVLHLGRGDFLSINNRKGNIYSDIFNVGFTSWFSELIKSAKEEGFEEAIIIIPMESKFLSKYNQLTKTGASINRLNPIHEEVMLYLKAIMEKLSDLAEEFPITFLLKGFGWSCDSSGNMAIYDTFTLNKYKEETNEDFLLGSGNFEDYYISNENSDKVAKWLSSKLSNSLEELCGSFRVGVILDSLSVLRTDYLDSINNSYKEWLSYTNSIYVSNTIWDVPDYLGSSILDAAIEKFGLNDYSNLAYYIDGVDEVLAQKKISLKDNWDIITKYINYIKYELGVENVIMSSGYAIRGDSFFLFVPLPYIELTKIDLDYEVAICKANKSIVAYMKDAKVNSIVRTVDDIDEIQLEIPKYINDRFSHKKIKNYYYDEVKTERLILLNDNEYFVIKDISESIGEGAVKSITAYSLEHKLTKRVVVLGNTSLQLYSDDPEQPDGIINILEKETGWKLGYIDEKCRFEHINGIITTKYRWFESVDTTWYTFLKEDVEQSFDCLIQFNSANKTVNIYPNVHLGNDTGLYLSEDNYIKSLEKVDTTQDIVTRLSLVGKEELKINEINPTGTDYIEDFSYFIKNNEMSSELVKALEEYDKTVNSLYERWKELSTKLLNNNKLLRVYQQDKKILEAEKKVKEDLVKEYESIKNTHIEELDKLLAEKQEHLNKEETDLANKKDELAKIEQDSIDKINEEIERLKADISILETDIKDIDINVSNIETENPSIESEIEKINSFISRENTIDANGDKIFTPQLLSELQEFIYHDTFEDDSFMTAETLMEGGINALKTMAEPTIDYNIDVVNFLARTIKKRKWYGELYLRDIVKLDLIDGDVIDLFVVGFTFNPQDKTIDMVLSNKVKTQKYTKTIASMLKRAKETTKLVNINKYLWTRQKNQEKEE